MDTHASIEYRYQTLPSKRMEKSRKRKRKEMDPCTGLINGKELTDNIRKERNRKPGIRKETYDTVVHVFVLLIPESKVRNRLGFWSARHSV